MYKVIIADDEAHIVNGLRHQTGWEAYNMEVAGTASNGQEALELLAIVSADFLITDVCMPHMDGLELITRAKQINPSLRCVIISAHSEFDYVRKALQLGVENYLLKPINESELEETLVKTMKNLECYGMISSPPLPDILAFRHNVLDRWVNGSIQDFELYERAELLKLNLSAPEYEVCVFELSAAGQSLEPIRDSALLLDLCRMHLLQNFTGECFLDGSCRVVAVLSGSDLSCRLNELEHTIGQFREFSIMKGLTFFASIGPLAASSTQVSKSYAAALLYLYYPALQPGADKVLANPLLLDPRSKEGERLANLMLGFEQSLQEGVIPSAIQTLLRYLEQWNASRFDVQKNEILPFILLLIRKMVESGKVHDGLPGEIKSCLERFSDLADISALTAWLAETASVSIQVIQKRNQTYHLLVRHMLDQIQQNYAADISLKTLAYSLGVSSAYLGQLFKEETGKYFTDYLTEMRLQASKTLLLDTSLKISEVASRVGIPNHSYYNRLFKKLYGMSPLEFKRRAALMI